MSEVEKLSNNKEIIAYLAEKFPLCFSTEGEAKPLKIGIFQDLAEALKDDTRVSKTQLRQALRQYTSNWRYLHGCRLGAVRVDLLGNESGILEQEHVEHAMQQLEEAKAKIAEKKVAQKAAQKAANATKKRILRTEDKSAQVKPKQNQVQKPRKPKFELTPVNIETLQKQTQVKIKVGDSVKKGIILELVKDSARIQLDNGLVMNVTIDHLFM